MDPLRQHGAAREVTGRSVECGWVSRGSLAPPPLLRGLRSTRTRP